MNNVKTNIIPIKSQLVSVNAKHELDLKAICVFAAIGFFLDDDSYYKDQKVLKPATINSIDNSGKLLNSEPWFQWHYTPRNITFNQALDEFINLFETIIKDQTKEKKVILPLSGGLDSRTQAVALKALGAEVSAYSYAFENGYDEVRIAREIAEACHFDFNEFTIKKGYLWNVLEPLSKLNRCYSDFTTPRQMGVFGNFDDKGDVFSLGHWGDVLFDNMNLPTLPISEQLDVIISKLLKKGGMAFASHLWSVWAIEGDFESYFRSRVHTLLTKINIDDTNARIRAFKSLYWAPRWTSVNLSIFEAQKPIELPYYDNRMCEFICTIPEAYLSGRQLQLAYIKKRNPKLAAITWQDVRPYNLNNYHKNRLPFNAHYKLRNKLNRLFNKIKGEKYIQRNWELQFLGASNKGMLEEVLYDKGLDSWIPRSFIENYINRFYNENTLLNAQAINMLLVFSIFNQAHNS